MSLRAMALAWVALLALSLGTLAADDDLGLGRHPWQNLVRTAGDMAVPSLVQALWGEPRRDIRDETGQVLRVAHPREDEQRFLAGMARALWTTLRIASLGTALAALIALPLGLLGARSLGAPARLAAAARGVLDALRAVHTLVFGLLMVGIVGLGATAGLLAVALHSAGTLGKLLAESIEALDRGPIEAVEATGARPAQVFALGVWPAVRPQFMGHILYIWEFNLRDSTILGLVGAGGLGLLLSEAMSLFQWARLSTLLLAIVLMVTAFDALSRQVRARLQ